MEAKGQTFCRWPRCSCKATGEVCEERRKQQAKASNKKPSGIKKISAKGRVKKIEKGQLTDSDAALYLIIWQEREHKCQCCDEPIFEFSILLFHHILPKRPRGGYPQYRHCKWNIWILCWKCHDTHDNGNPESKTISKLRKEYRRLLKLHEDGKLRDVESNKDRHSI